MMSLHRLVPKGLSACLALVVLLHCAPIGAYAKSIQMSLKTISYEEFSDTCAWFKWDVELKPGNYNCFSFCEVPPDFPKSRSITLDSPMTVDDDDVDELDGSYMVCGLSPGSAYTCGFSFANINSSGINYVASANIIFMPDTPVDVVADMYKYTSDCMVFTVTSRNAKFSIQAYEYMISCNDEEDHSVTCLQAQPGTCHLELCSVLSPVNISHTCLPIIVKNPGNYLIHLPPVEFTLLPESYAVRNVDVEVLNSSCASYTWDLDERNSSQYVSSKISCIGEKEWSHGTQKASAVFCAEQHGIEIHCRIVSEFTIGITKSEFVSYNTTCVEPDKPFVTSIYDEKTSTGTMRQIKLAWEKPDAGCRRIVKYNVQIAEFGSIIVVTDEVATLYGLKPFTSYTISVTALNDDGLYSPEYVITHVTGGDMMVDSPIVTLEANTTCINLSMKPSSESSATEITKYLFGCSYIEIPTVLKYGLVASKPDLKVEKILCGFLANREVRCQVIAKTDDAQSSVVTVMARTLSRQQESGNNEVQLKVGAMVGGDSSGATRYSLSSLLLMVPALCVY